MDSILVGQYITAEKRARAKQLRQHMTEAEKQLWQQLRANRFHGFQFRRQQIIDGFIVDFYCDALRLIVEVDGPIHDRQTEADREREYVLSGRDLTILRFTNDLVLHDVPTVLARVLAITEHVDARPR